MSLSTEGAYNELSFLTNLPTLTNHDNRDSIFNYIFGEFKTDEKGNVVISTSDPKKSVIFKKQDVNDTTSLKNYYKDTIYNSSGEKYSDVNPYLKLFKDFKAKSFNAMSFQAADFSYLTDLGVYPINRLWVLRRYGENMTVPSNLQNWGTDTPPSPNRTIVGWLPPEQDNMFNMSFHEDWTKSEERIDELIMRMVKDKSMGGIDLKQSLSSYGFTQGLVFGFLNEMGLTEYDLNNVPMGDPAVLQEAASRATSNEVKYANKSAMSLTLKTSYEQKFIGDIDPGSAMMDIIENAIYMGTRDTKYIFGGAENSDIIKDLRKANNTGNAEDWMDTVTTIIKSFFTAIGKVFKNVIDTVKGSSDLSILDTIAKISTGGFQTLIASTITTWRFALRGSISVMTGANSTPWHLSIGNPYSPFISLGNIVVKTVDFKFNNEFAYNDMPTKLDVTITAELGRNLGAQEIFAMFNNGYQRIYDLPKNSSAKGKSVSSEGNKNTTKSTKDSEDENKPAKFIAPIDASLPGEPPKFGNIQTF